MHVIVFNYKRKIFHTLMLFLLVYSFSVKEDNILINLVAIILVVIISGQNSLSVGMVKAKSQFGGSNMWMLLFSVK